jgi:hypothetical protein
MNFNAHGFAVSAYMTLMFTSAFLTLKVPGPLSFAAAGAGFEAAFGRISAKLELTGMTLPEASEVVIEPTAAGELKKIADKVEQGEEVTKIPGKLCTLFGLSEGAPIPSKSVTVMISEKVDARGIQVASNNGSRIIVFSVYAGNQGTWYLTDEDGMIKKAATALKGQPFQEVAVTEAERPFGQEKSFWVSRLGEVVVGKAGS